ncbi:type 4a pilus biogenesis protein PilO [Microbacter sp. GSS18]|nr:type 4a pilus biogenesis protein PilO [Microbacter sp. GSS18]
MMPKQLINLLGILVTVGILAVVIALIALPIYFQSLQTSAQTAQVAQTNDVYQAQVDTLRAESERMGEIQASVDALRTQIPEANDLDDVFEVVARAAGSSGVTVESITAGENVAFVPRTEALAIGEATAATQPDASTEASTDGETAAPEAGVSASPDDGRQQVDFVIVASATELSEVVRFLDELRRGPRALSNIETTVTSGDADFSVSVAALTFVLPEA